MPWVLLIGVVAFVLSSGGVSRTGRAEELVVNCFDETSNIVETTLIGNCDGTIVTDEKAEATIAWVDARPDRAGAIGQVINKFWQQKEKEEKE